MRGTLFVGLLVALAPGCKDEPDNPKIHSYERAEPKDAAPAIDASPWAELGLASEQAVEEGTTVWAAAVDDRGRWALNRFQVDASLGDTVMVQRRIRRRAPQGLVQASNTEVPAPNTPVLFASDRAEFGVVVGTAAGKVKVATVTFSGATVEQELSADEILPISGDTYGFGAPALYQGEKGEVHFGVVVGRGDGQIHLLRGVGKSSPMVSLPSARVRLIDHDEPLRKGQQVWFRSPTAGHASGKLDAGTIHLRLGNSGYSVKAPNRGLYKVPWAFVAPR